MSSFDGTITADIPSGRLTELFNCNNFIVSQVNPHVNFLLHLAEEGTAGRGFPKSGEHLRFTSNAPVTVQTEARACDGSDLSLVTVCPYIVQYAPNKWTDVLFP